MTLNVHPLKLQKIKLHHQIQQLATDINGERFSVIQMVVKIQIVLLFSLTELQVLCALLANVTCSGSWLKMRTMR